MRPLLGMTAVTVAVGVLPLGCGPLAPTPSPRSAATVVWVSDGDTIDVTRDGSTVRERIRLLGIDAPEKAHDGQPAACGGDEAWARLQAMLPKGTVVVIVDDARADSPDRYGRTLAYIEAGGVDVGGQLIAEGLVAAWVPDSAATPERWRAYRSSMDSAKQARAGSWARCERLGR